MDFGSITQVADVQDNVFTSLSSYPFVANSGIYLATIASAELSSHYVSAETTETVPCISLGLRACPESGEGEPGQLWVDVDTVVHEGRQNHGLDLAVLTGSLVQRQDPATGQMMQVASFAEKVEHLQKARPDGRTEITVFPGVIGHQVLVAVQRWRKDGRDGRPRFRLVRIFGTDGRTPAEAMAGKSAARLNDLRSKLPSEGNPLWKRPAETKKTYTVSSYGARTGAAYGAQTGAAYGQGVQASAYGGGVRASKPAPQPVSQGTYGYDPQAAQAQAQAQAAQPAAYGAQPQVAGAAYGQGVQASAYGGGAQTGAAYGAQPQGAVNPDTQGDGNDPIPF